MTNASEHIMTLERFPHHGRLWDGNPLADSGYDVVMALRLVVNAAFMTFYIVFFGNKHIESNDIYSQCLSPKEGYTWHHA